MTSTLIILAHPRSGSFNHSWAEASADASRRAGHTVHVSDLYADGFDPLYFDDGGAISDVVEKEIERVKRADRLIFHFPLWWFAPPAILKGWFDRVLAHGHLHSSQRRFDTGICRGKSALFCVTTGSTAAESAPDGKEGDVRMHLWPSAYTLRYCGFDILQPLTVHSVHGFQTGEAAAELAARLADVLAHQPKVIRDFDSLPKLDFNADTEFTEAGTLRQDAVSHSLFIRHPEP